MARLSTVLVVEPAGLVAVILMGRLVTGTLENCRR